MPDSSDIAFIQEKNKAINQPLDLWEIWLTDSDVVSLTSADSDIEFAGVLHTSFPMSHEDVSQNIKGSVDTCKLLVSNVDRLAQFYLENYNGLRGKKCIKKTVWRDHLDDADNVRTEIFLIDSSAFDERQVELILTSNFDLMSVLLPLRVYDRTFCSWIFKSDECGYVGAETSCTHKFKFCESLGNERRFGAFPSIPDPTIYNP